MTDKRLEKMQAMANGSVNTLTMKIITDLSVSHRTKELEAELDSLQIKYEELLEAAVGLSNLCEGTAYYKEAYSTVIKHKEQLLGDYYD